MVYTIVGTELDRSAHHGQMGHFSLGHVSGWVKINNRIDLRV